MIHSSDPLERLRMVNPVPSPSTLSPPDLPLFRRITSVHSDDAFVTSRRRWRRRPRRVVPVLAVLGSLAGGAVAYGLLGGGVSKPHQVACYERADLGARTEVVGVGRGGPLEACADLWRRGILGRGGGGEVPALAECALASGVAGVFPTTSGAEVCAQLTLAAVPSTAPPGGPTAPQADVNTRILAFRDAVLPHFLDTPCLEPRTAAGVVRRELDRAGLGEWTVRGGEGLAVDGFSPERPCATLSLRPEAREILLVPAPPRR